MQRQQYIIIGVSLRFSCGGKPAMATALGNRNCPDNGCRSGRAESALSGRMDYIEFKVICVRPGQRQRRTIWIYGGLTSRPSLVKWPVMKVNPELESAKQVNPGTGNKRKKLIVELAAFTVVTNQDTID